MSPSSEPPAPSTARAVIIAAAGIVILLLAASSAFLPVFDRVSGARIVGGLLTAGGLAETIAGTQRHDNRVMALLAGGVTTLAGLLFLLNPVAHFFPTVTIVTGWLLIRSVILMVASRRAHGSVRLWLGLSAATDLVLGLLLLVGLSISTLIITLFGPTPELVASFAWILALSFVVTGALLLEVAACERESSD